MGMFKKIASTIFAFFLLTVVLTFTIDFMLMQIYKDNLQYKIFMAGEYVTKLSPDETLLASGTIQFVDRDVIDELERFSDAAFRLPGVERDLRRKNDREFHAIYDYDGKNFIGHIEVYGRIITAGGQSGVQIGLIYVIPSTSKHMLFAQGNQLIPDHRIGIERNFRITGL